MSIPDYQAIMLPLLKFIGDGKEHSIREAIEILANQFGLTPEERQTLLPSGQQPVFDNRVGWARTYMKKAGLLEAPRRGYIRITERGINVLRQKPDRIDVKFLSQYSEFRKFRSGESAEEIPTGESQYEEDRTPEELLGDAYKKLKESLASELLEQVEKAATPEFFERLVVQLLVAMGYGGTFKEAAQAVGRSGDEGIDGIINEDPLGLDVIYIQAKRWGNHPVGLPDLQSFVGALEGKRAHKGVFITTSTFTKDAQEYASSTQMKIVLIDGHRLVDLMIEYNVGMSTTMIYQIKKVDHDFFVEE